MKLSKNYTLGEAATNELDLTPIKTAPFSLMLEAEKTLRARGEISSLIESDLSALLIFAALAIELPEEDLLSLNLYDGQKVEAEISDAFRLACVAEGDQLRLSVPYTFRGNEYTKINFSGAADLTMRDLCDAQHAAERLSGLVCVNPRGDSWCLLVLASRATKLPVDFFTEAPAGVGYMAKLMVKRLFFSEPGLM